MFYNNNNNLIKLDQMNISQKCLILSITVASLTGSVLGSVLFLVWKPWNEHWSRFNWIARGQVAIDS